MYKGYAVIWLIVCGWGVICPLITCIVLSVNMPWQPPPRHQHLAKPGIEGCKRSWWQHNTECTSSHSVSPPLQTTLLPHQTRICVWWRGTSAQEADSGKCYLWRCFVVESCWRDTFCNIQAGCDAWPILSMLEVWITWTKILSLEPLWSEALFNVGALEDKSVFPLQISQCALITPPWMYGTFETYQHPWG